MTQDVLMTGNDQSVAKPASESSRNQLLQFCILARSVHGLALMDIIKQVLSAPNIYVFGELLAVQSVQELKGGENEKYLNTLNLFAYGTYQQYRQNADNYIELTPAMQRKLQHLTLVSLAIKTKSIPYAVLLKELALNNVRDLEDLIIEAIYADIIHGKIFQQERYLEIDYAQGRDIPPGCIGKIAETLEEWVSSCESICKCIELQIERANAEKLKHLSNKECIEQDLKHLKKSIIKTDMTENEEPMQIDCVRDAPANQDARKKSIRNKTTRAVDPSL